jgi:hypothetical protein
MVIEIHLALDKKEQRVSNDTRCSFFIGLINSLRELARTGA